MRTLLIALLTGLTSPALAAAQLLQPWGDAAPRGASLDLFRPAFNGGGTSTLTTINQLNLRWRVGSVALVAELPFVIAKADGATSGATLMGNPFLGVASNPSSAWIGELGIRIPVVKVSSPEADFAQTVGVFGDFTDFEAYANDILTTRATFGYRHRTPNHVAVRVALRPTLMSPTGDNMGDSELFLDYGAQVGYESDRVRVGAAFNGRAWATESDLSFGERTVHELGLGAAMTFGRFRPGLLLRVPLDRDLTEMVSTALGVKLELTF
jgi:hypothetical protein